MNDYIQLLNEANKVLGYFNEEITTETVAEITALSEEQQKALFNQMYLVAEQRGHENIFSAEKNSFRSFIVDAGEFGWTIQDYMLEVLDGVTPQWRVNEYTDVEQAENLVKDYEQSIKSSFHYERFGTQFPTTIRDYEYKKSFYPSKLGAFVNRKIGMLNTSAEIYLQNQVLIDEIMSMFARGDMIKSTGHTVNNSNGILSLLENVKTAYEGFMQPNSIYNIDDVISITPDENLIYLVCKASTLNRIKVREYSGAFNLEQMKLDGRIIIIPEDYPVPTVEVSEGVNETPLFFVLDRRSIVIGIKLWKMGTFYVANQYKTNHWLGVEGIRGHNKFINAVAFTGEEFGNFQ